MAKKISGLIKLQIPAGGANPSPPVGPALGQNGVNIMEFCKAFNEHTKEMEKGIPIPVVITVYTDRSFTFKTTQPPMSYFIKKATKIKKGSQVPGQGFIASLSRAQVEDIANKKMADLNANDLEGACLMVAGSARSMGIEIKG